MILSKQGGIRTLETDWTGKAAALLILPDIDYSIVIEWFEGRQRDAVTIIHLLRSPPLALIMIFELQGAHTLFSDFEAPPDLFEP